jgi:hypothetical protein
MATVEAAEVVKVVVRAAAGEVLVNAGVAVTQAAVSAAVAVTRRT